MDNVFKSNIVIALNTLANPINDQRLKEANKFILEHEKNPEYFSILIEIFENDNVT